MSAAGRSRVRQHRLLLLCYHGVSSGIESKYSSDMFIPTPVFARRMQLLKDLEANVLNLGEAIQLLAEDRLPPRSTVLTFDDGWADFKSDAFPILQKHGFPATVYLTTYYCRFNVPIFRWAIGYLLWSCRTRVIENARFPFLPVELDLRSAENRSTVLFQLDEFAKKNNLSGRAKNDLVAELVEMLAVAYQPMLRERLFHLMNPEEVAEISKAGIDVQLHTHRHRTPLDRVKFVAEIVQNRQYIREMVGKDGLVHFCYPSGANRPDFLPWLGEAEIESATTCVSGFLTKSDDPLLAPRLLDQEAISETEFESWISGFAALIPRRRIRSLDVAPE